MHYRLNFCVDPTEPMPSPCGLAFVEAADPIAAVYRALELGLVPQDKVYAWARVVVSLHADGSVRQVLRVPITPEGRIPVDWRPGVMGD
jgi:hypothetical protein